MRVWVAGLLPALGTASRCRVCARRSRQLTILQAGNQAPPSGRVILLIRKTTLLGTLAGLDLPSSGDVWLAGEHISALDEGARAQVRAHAVGLVFQNFQLLVALTA